MIVSYLRCILETVWYSTRESNYTSEFEVNCIFSNSHDFTVLGLNVWLLGFKITALATHKKENVLIRTFLSRYLFVVPLATTWGKKKNGEMHVSSILNKFTVQWAWFTCGIILISMGTNVSSSELRMFCPEHPNFIENLCTCPHNLDSKDKTTVTNCAEKVETISGNVFFSMKNLTEDWEDIKEPGCNRPHDAFKQSAVLPDYTNQLGQFYQKLRSCKAENTVSIAILGGSVTLGKSCYGLNINPKDTDHLELPQDIKTVQRGDDLCPWSNRLFTLLKKQYPQCGHIDVYNLAHSGTNTEYALNHLESYFTAVNGARGGKTVGEVVDLVIVDYGVNDGTIDEKPMLAKLKKTAGSEYNYVQTVEVRKTICSVIFDNGCYFFLSPHLFFWLLASNV
jgi:hypothetical protein